MSDESDRIVPADSDWNLIEALLRAAKVILAFYGHTYSEETLQDKLTNYEVISFLKAQVNLQGPDDFQTSPLRSLLFIVEAAPKQVNAMIKDALDKIK